jgi:uncharacterized membrane protein YoaK (UPF0700 family)
MKRTVIKSVLIGCLLGTMPLWPWFRLGHRIHECIYWLMLPGYVVGAIFSGGRVHDVNEIMMVSASCAFYTAMTYVILRLLRKRKR